MQGFVIQPGESIFDRCKKIPPSKVLAAFGITINEYDKVVCPFHQEDTPSMQVNAEYVYCYGCRKSFDTYGLIVALLTQQGLPYHAADVSMWLDKTTLPDVVRGASGYSNYRGPVNMELINYWESCMTPERYRQLEHERLLNEATAKYFRIGWRPDWSAWVIPFISGGVCHSVQFRMPSSFGMKYMGLKGHNKPVLINADARKSLLLMPYVVVLFGSFDPLLAWQDGLPVVGTMGASAFPPEAELKTWFAGMKKIYIVPDNTPTEFEGAKRLAEIVGGHVRYFPTSFPEGTDYTDMRKLGYGPEFFKRHVLQHLPKLAKDAWENTRTYGLDDYWEWLYQEARGTVVEDLATELFWVSNDQDFVGIQDYEALFEKLTMVARNNGAW